MGTPTDIVRQAYAAFGRKDIAGILALLSDDVDWRLYAGEAAGISYGGKFTGTQQGQAWFGMLAESDDIQGFEAREFLEGPDHVTVLGWERGKPLPKGSLFETEWVHVFNVKNGKITRWIGTADTAARVAAAR